MKRRTCSSATAARGVAASEGSPAQMYGMKATSLRFRRFVNVPLTPTLLALVLPICIVLPSLKRFAGGKIGSCLLEKKRPRRKKHCNAHEDQDTRVCGSMPSRPFFMVLLTHHSGRRLLLIKIIDEIAHAASRKHCS